jgi:NADH:ubiquinone oxidoreductase subunit F (NADH-binding)
VQGLQNGFKRLVQRRAGTAAQVLEAPDHATGVKGNPQDLAVQIGRAKGGLAPQLMFDIRQDFEQLRVGFQDLLEVGVLVVKGRHEFIVRGGRPLSFFEQVQHPDIHDAPPC